MQASSTVMFFRPRPRQPRLTPQQQLAARPVHLVRGELDRQDGGSAKLNVPLKPARWNRWVFRIPQGTIKTFELDALGVLVWDLCDGHNSVQQIIRKLAKRYNLNLREAQVPTIKFLQMLTRKGLIGMTMPRQREPAEPE